MRGAAVAHNIANLNSCAQSALRVTVPSSTSFFVNLYNTCAALPVAHYPTFLVALAAAVLMFYMKFSKRFKKVCVFVLVCMGFGWPPRCVTVVHAVSECPSCNFGCDSRHGSVVCGNGGARRRVCAPHDCGRERRWDCGARYDIAVLVAVVRRDHVSLGS